MGFLTNLSVYARLVLVGDKLVGANDNINIKVQTKKMFNIIEENGHKNITLVHTSQTAKKQLKITMNNFYYIYNMYIMLFPKK